MHWLLSNLKINSLCELIISISVAPVDRLDSCCHQLCVIQSAGFAAVHAQALHGPTLFLFPLFLSALLCSSPGEYMYVAYMLIFRQPDLLYFVVKHLDICIELTPVFHSNQRSEQSGAIHRIQL